MEDNRFATEGRFEKDIRSTKEDEFVYAPKSATQIPDDIKEHFAKEGFRLRWVRWMDGEGKIDAANIRRTMHQDGFEFVTPKEMGDTAKSLGEFETIDRFGECVTLGTLVLMKVPHFKAEARRKYYEKEANSKINATNEMLRRNAIENGSKTTTRTGKRAAYAGD